MPYASPADKAAWAKRYHREHREDVNRNKAAWAQRNRDKRKAQIALGNALRDGHILRGACDVGRSCVGRVEGHHDDYARPLEVRWLCDAHHKEVHREERRNARYGG